MYTYQQWSAALIPICLCAYISICLLSVLNVSTEQSVFPMDKRAVFYSLLPVIPYLLRITQLKLECYIYKTSSTTKVDALKINTWDMEDDAILELLGCHTMVCLYPNCFH